MLQNSLRAEMRIQAQSSSTENDRFSSEGCAVISPVSRKGRFIFIIPHTVFRAESAFSKLWNIYVKIGYFCAIRFQFKKTIYTRYGNISEPAASILSQD